MVDQLITRETLVAAVIAALVWAFSHYFIRLGLNPEVTEEDRLTKRQDTFYGALAAFVGTILKAIIKARMG